MGDHHHHHGHHSIMNHTTPSPLVTTAAPNVTTALLQTLLTTVISPDRHYQHHDPSSHLINSGIHDMGLESSKHSHSSHLTTSSGLANGHNMIMYFHTGIDVTILFKDWNIASSQGMIGSVIGIFLMAMLYEGIKFFREYMFKQHYTSLEYSSVAVLADNGKTVTEVHRIARNRMFSWPHIVQTCLHVVQMVLSYFLMLIFMTYNVWLCLGVVLGAGTGYFLFGWKKATVVDITEHCN